MGLTSYLLRRLAFSGFVIFSVLTLTFVLAHLIPGNPVKALLGPQLSNYPALVAALTKQYHFDAPIYVQYYYYLVNLVHGNLGYSTSRGLAPVSQVIALTLPYTAQIVFFAFVFTFVIGVPVGVVSARYFRRSPDVGIRAAYLTGISSPSFFVALVLLILFTYYFRILPSGGAVGSNVTLPHPITGVPMIDSLLELNWSYFTSALRHVILPSLSLAVGTTAFVTRITRASMAQVLTKNYVRTARAKGVDERSVFFKHVMRNGLIPVVTITSLIFYFMMAGTLFVENIFAYPGLGQYVVGALTSQDYAGIMATTLVFALIILVANLAVDLSYAAVDPRIRMS